MSTLEHLKAHLQEGQVYRRDELTQWSKSVGRHLHALLKEGVLQKLSQGVYYYPKNSSFGKIPRRKKFWYVHS
ncbi:hypothetical protein ACFFGT_02275 [Mucilaginibacter angelicae]|uniref:Transcriptional regulator AbiEi antitoxin N-terminal domain-containing protein n=1 Tax=Mucilaginibacter angelicae TaxID=869718 RepID=A0ABV6KZU7_9SPHI